MSLLRPPDASRTPWVVDGLAAVLVVVLVGLELFEANPDPALPAVVFAGAGVGALFVRRRWLIPALAAGVVARIALAVATGSGLVLQPAIAVLLYETARHGPRRHGLGLALAAASVSASVGVALGDDGFVLGLVEEGAQAFLPVAIGDALRTRADRVRDLIEAEAEARVQAERLRIARDLHDVVSHGLSAIAIQAGVAARLLDQDPNQAKEALVAINATGRSSLEELRAMVGGLRSTAEPALQPVPAYTGALNEVVALAERSGVRVTVTTTGGFPAEAADAAVLATHRIVQEALMNVARHAGAVQAAVALRHGPSSVEIDISNDPPAANRPEVASTGVGIIGMRERAEFIGGSLHAEPTRDGGFRVTATIPYGGRPR